MSGEPFSEIGALTELQSPPEFGELISAPQWVAVHETLNGSREYRLNVDHIVGVSRNRAGQTVVYLTTRSELIVDEALDEIAPLHE